MSRWLVRWLTLALLLSPAVARAQGLLVVIDPDRSVRLPRPHIIWPPRPEPRPMPIPPDNYTIKQLEVQARLIDQVAQVRVSQSFVNTGSRQLEVSFIFPLPYDGAIDQMTLMVDGKEYPAKLLSADEARRVYESIVRKNKDPALLEWIGTGMFRTNVFPVPPGATRTVSMRYSQICRKQEGLTDFLFPLSTAKYTSRAVENVDVRVSVESQEPIKNVYSPTHAVQIKRPDERHATVSYSTKNEVPGSDFRLFYDVGRETVSMRVLSYRPAGQQDGFFLLLATPKIEAGGDRAKKTVVFCVDRSGSMSGKKIDQVRAALKFVLDNLRPGDLFNIVAYDSEVETFRPELQRYDDNTRKAAQGFVEGLYAGGSTNIDAALRAALGQLQDSKQPGYVLFLTDGLPTVGVTNEGTILQDAREANRVRARVFAFGVGYDVNSRLLDKLVRDNHGQSFYVRPNEDIEESISRLYRRIESPVMTDAKIEFAFDEKPRPEQGPPIVQVYPKGNPDLFAGEQLVIVGRYKKFGAAKVVVSGSVAGKPQKFDFPAKFVERSPDESYAFIERLWAMRRVGEILEELDFKGKNEELVKELVELSTRHGILTPYTSFLADENTNVNSLTDNMRRADVRLESLEREQSGAGGVSQRAFRGNLQQSFQAPAMPAMGVDSFARDRAAAAPAAEAARGMMPGAPGSRPSASSIAGRVRRDGGGAMGYGAGGMGGGIAAKAAGKPADDMSAAAGEMQNAQQTVRNIGNRAFYRRANQWIDSTLTATQQQNPSRVKQFSKEYFDLARRHGRTLSQYLVFDEPVLLNISGQAYLIEP